MRQSVLDAIKAGDWNYEPDESAVNEGFSSTSALPGSNQKLKILAERIRAGLPLWHPDDRLTYVGSPEDED